MHTCKEAATVQTYLKYTIIIKHQLSLSTHTAYLTGEYVCISVAGLFRALPVVLCQVLLQMCDALEFIEEPLVYECQLVNQIHAHPTVEGLGGRGMKQTQSTNITFINSSYKSQPVIKLKAVIQLLT